MIHSYGALEVQLGREIAVPALLNPQEHVWEHTRDAISHNHSYGSFGPLLADFETCLNETLFACDFIE
jgi:hypothetical protein